MTDPTTICEALGMELVEVIAQRRGSILLKARRHGQIVAVKGYDPDETDTYDRKQLLVTEADLLREVNGYLSEPLFVDFVSNPTDGTWLTTRWVEGPTATEYVRGLTSNTLAGNIELFIALSGALGRIHDAGYLHGDVQAAHVILPERTLAPVFIDWGLGRRERDSVPYSGGFVHYVAPEIAAGMLKQKTDIHYTRAAEIYSVGALMALCLTGTTAVNYGMKDSLPQKLEQVVRGNLRVIANGETDKERELASLIRRCLAFNPQDRPVSLEEVSTALSML